MAQLINFSSTPKFKKQYQKLPASIKNKFAKQLNLLEENYRHPSLQTKKMEGVDSFEARIDLHYRFSFEITEAGVSLLSIGPHDVGLGQR